MKENTAARLPEDLILPTGPAYSALQCLWDGQGVSPCFPGVKQICGVSQFNEGCPLGSPLSLRTTLGNMRRGWDQCRPKGLVRELTASLSEAYSRLFTLRRREALWE